MTTDTKAIAAPTLGLMLDCETLSLRSRALVTQIALVPFSIETEELLPDALHIYLPMQAQLELIPARLIDAQTFVWWMGQSDEARAAFEYNVSDEFDDLPILMRQFVNRFNKLTKTNTVDYELIAAGPQADAVWVETLLQDCGMKAPWKYDRVTDLRTMKRLAGITQTGLEPPKGYIPHRADWDCKFQIQAYFEAKRQLRSLG